jgi:hypothetical protein
MKAADMHARHFEPTDVEAAAVESAGSNTTEAADFEPAEATYLQAAEPANFDAADSTEAARTGR